MLASARRRINKPRYSRCESWRRGLCRDWWPRDLSTDNTDAQRSPPRPPIPSQPRRAVSHALPWRTRRAHRRAECSRPYARAHAPRGAIRSLDTFGRLPAGIGAAKPHRERAVRGGEASSKLFATAPVPLTKAQSGRPPESAWAKMSPKWAKMSQKWAKMSQKWAKMGLNDPPKSGF